MAETRWQDVFLHLKNKGYDVYSPGQHTGECLSPYIVVKEGISLQAQQLSSMQDMLELLVYVPESNYSTLTPFVGGVEDAMREMLPMIRPAHSRDAPYHDTDVKAFMVSIGYINYRKMK